MKNNYLCPKCRANLKVRENIILSARLENNKTGIILISPQLGNYKVLKHSSFVYEEGERLSLFCPVCHESLEMGKGKNSLAKVLMIDENNSESEIYFSEIAGEHCTYKIENKEIEAYGDDSDNYSNFFGAGFNY